MGNKTKKRTLHCEDWLPLERIERILQLVEPNARVTDVCWIGCEGVIGPMTFQELKRQSTPLARKSVVWALLDHGYGRYIDDYLVGEHIPFVVQGFVQKVLRDLDKAKDAEDQAFLKSLGVAASPPEPVCKPMPKPAAEPGPKSDDDALWGENTIRHSLRHLSRLPGCCASLCRGSAMPPVKLHPGGRLQRPWPVPAGKFPRL